MICTATKCLAKLWIVIVARGPSRGSYMIRIVFFRASKVYSCPFEVHPGFPPCVVLLKKHQWSDVSMNQFYGKCQAVNILISATAISDPAGVEIFHSGTSLWLCCAYA